MAVQKTNTSSATKTTGDLVCCSKSDNGKVNLAVFKFLTSGFNC